MPAITPRFRDYRLWESQNLRFFDGSPVTNVYGEPGWICQDLTNGDLYVHGATSDVTNWLKVSTGSALVSQQGDIALVNGQQSYALVFPVAFALAPTFVIASVHLPGPAGAGESFFVCPDRSTLTAAGVTFWLSGVPTAASAGAILNWLARA